MTWEEIRTRVGQEASKRLDLALYRAGLGPEAKALVPRPAHPPPFFFGSKHDEAAHRAALLHTHLSHEVDAIIHEADKLCRHEFHLLGYENLRYGANIDWHSDPVHGTQSPLLPWYKIDFLNFRAVGDHKVIWELNRHQHLVTLAKAWLLSGNSAYAKEVAAQFYSWQKENPYPIGINWASTLEVAFRSMSWLRIRNLLAECTDLPESFPTDLLLALQMHGQYIERYLSTYFSPNTHLLGEAVALLFLGTLCPEISSAARWRRKGWDILQEQSGRQVRPDGVYFEQSLYYHVYALDFFLHARILASENGFTSPEQFDSVLKQMLNVVHALSEAGPPQGFGDDDGGRLFNPRRNQIECMTDPLALGAVLYDCNQYATAGLTEEAIWLFGDKAIEMFGKPHAKVPSSSRAFEAGGIYLINDDQPRPQQLMIDAGPMGTGNSGHGHADALSIRFSLGGRGILVDSGTYCYISDGEDRQQFRGTGAHNTLRVDRLDQAVSEGPFAWSSIPNVKCDTWVNKETFDFFIGSHDGYHRLPAPVLHRRFVFHVKGGLWFVRDVAEGGGSHLLETFWHFAAGLQVKEERGVVVAESSPDDTEVQRARIALLIDRDSGWSTEIVEGYISPVYGSKGVAPVVRLSATATLPQELGVLLLPTTQVSEIGMFSAVGESTVPGVSGYRYQTERSAEFLFFANGKAPWTCGPWSSDAQLLYCKMESGRLRHVIMVTGTFGEWRGKRFVSHSSVAGSFEWVRRPGSKQDSPSAGNVPGDSVVSDFEVFDSVS
jgi:hypothetical protein